MPIKCHLSTLMGKYKMTIQDVHEKTGLNRNTISNLYREKIKRIDFDTIDKLCKLFTCKMEELFEYIDQINSEKESEGLEKYFLPVTEEDVKFIEMKHEELKDGGFMDDEEFFALLNDE